MSTSESKRILVIDDEPAFCTMMQELLASRGFQVDHAPHPIVAAERALSGDYDLVTLDLNLREFDGSEVWDLYKKVGVETPVVVVSGYLTQEIEDTLREGGITHFVSKPFKSSDLVRTIEDALGAVSS